MSQKEVIYLVGDFDHATEERWKRWAELTNRVIKQSTFVEIQGINNPLVILDDHGLNDAPLPALELGKRIHSTIEDALVIIDEVRDPVGEAVATYIIDQRNKPMPILGPYTRRTKGERKGGRNTRW